MNHEAAFWVVVGVSMIGASLLIHALEYAAPRVTRWVRARAAR